jgi:hypothetical protein
MPRPVPPPSARRLFEHLEDLVKLFRRYAGSGVLHFNYQAHPAGDLLLNRGPQGNRPSFRELDGISQHVCRSLPLQGMHGALSAASGRKTQAMNVTQSDSRAAERQRDGW